MAPKLATAGEKDLNMSVISIPDRGPMKNDLSIYDESRSQLVPTNLRPRDNQSIPVPDFNFPQYNIRQQEELNQTKTLVQQQQAEYDRLANSLQQKDQECAAKIQSVNSSLQAALTDLNKERQERLQFMLEADKLRKENEVLRYHNSRLEVEKNTLNKALGDLKRQRDQAGVQRMQIVAIRNFLLALELERIRLMFLEKEQECDLAKV